MSGSCYDEHDECSKYYPCGPECPRLFDASDVEWSSVAAADSHVIGAAVYDDRPLTRWEWVKVHVLRRRDPRLVGWLELSEKKSE